MTFTRTIAKSLHSIADAIGGLDVQAERETVDRANEALASIRESADKRLAAAEKESERREKLGLLNAKAPNRWRFSYYMRQGYRATRGQDSPAGHSSGGPPPDEGAECPICKKPLLLFWDINCRDPRFTAESPELFVGLDRLPLYYCCRRPEPTTYQVLPDRRVRMFRPDLRGWEETPFNEIPGEFARQPLALAPLPRDVEILRIIADRLTGAWLNPNERNLLAEYFGEKIRGPTDLQLSQFGGVPVCKQGPREIKCPNPECETHSMGDPIFRDKAALQMKELATIGMDGKFEFGMHFAQIVFHICWKCHTIHSEYRCD